MNRPVGLYIGLVLKHSAETDGGLESQDSGQLKEAVSTLQILQLQQRPTCGSGSRFYSINGKCNNLQHPLWGAAFQPFVRELDNAYHDGKVVPRLYTSGDNATRLPSARKVSTDCVGSVKQERYRDLDPTHSQNLMQFGQFFAHDLGLTPVMEGFNCCQSLRQDGFHPDTFNGGACFPIPVPEGDRCFHMSCMVFNRSVYEIDVHGVAQQMNAATHFIDQSTVYGSTQAASNSTRSRQNGTLRTDEHGMLPQDDTQKCLLHKPLNRCPMAGDNRVNVFPGLTATHLLFLKEHNRVAAALLNRHPGWTDEELFQNARAIVIAETQNLVYSEYLPAVLGSRVMKFFGLDSPARYNPQQNPSILNAFQTAAFRFGHSQITNVVRLSLFRSSSNISDIYFRPDKLLDSQGAPRAGDLFQCLMWKRAQRFDHKLAEGLSDFLFLGVDQKGHSSDLAARNVQRGRDHGLPPYLHYLERARSEFGSTSDILREVVLPNHPDVYKSPEDIDLFVGGLYEEPVPGGVVGPVFAHLIGKQFKHLREGDRLFFDTQGSGAGFTQAQVDSIKRTSYAGIICRNFDMDLVREDAFSIYNRASNPFVNCTSLPDLDFSLW